MNKIINNFELSKDIESVQLVNNYKGSSPFLSIVIPTYSRLNLLKQLLDVLRLNKTNSEYEIVIVDNSSIVENNKNKMLVDEYPDLPINMYVNKKNLGMEGNFNRGIQLAKSEFISMIHDDDLVVSNYLQDAELIINKIMNKKKIALVKTSRFVFRGDGIPDCVFSNNKSFQKSIIPVSLVDTYFSGSSILCGPTSGYIMRKKALLATGGFSPSFNPSSDNEYGYRILSSGYKAYITSWNLGLYRIMVNETIKKETLTAFIKCNYEIIKHTYKRTFFGAIISILFGRYIYCLNIDTVANAANNYFGVGIGETDLDFRKKYKEYSVLFKFIFKILAHLFASILKRRKIVIYNNNALYK